MVKTDREIFFDLLEFYFDTNDGDWQEAHFMGMRNIVDRNQNTGDGDGSFTELQWNGARDIVAECEKIEAARKKIDDIANSDLFR